MAGGALLIAASLVIMGYNLWDERRAGQAAAQVLEQMPETVKSEALSDGGAPPEVELPEAEAPQVPDYILNPGMEMPTIEIEGNTYIGVLEIPDLDLTLPVMDTWSYPQLRIAPCRYAGSAYKPGFVIAAHNYNTHFGLLNNLRPEALVYFTDTDGSKFTYQVVELQTLEPTAIEDMVEDSWDLTLFTCTLGGKFRVTVRCELVEM